MHPLLALTLGMLGATVLARWCVKEIQRVNSELNSVRERAPVDSVDRSELPKLKRDPKSGEYRPG
jgi:hypothetical protein